MKRNYGKYSDETTIITAFEEYEASINTGFGEQWEDFIDWYECFRAGYLTRAWGRE